MEAHIRKNELDVEAAKSMIVEFRPKKTAAANSRKDIVGPSKGDSTCAMHCTISWSVR